MFGVELVAGVIGLAAIALAYFVFNYSLREKTFEEALAEQRGDSSESGKGQKKDKTKKPKKKAPLASDSDASPKTIPTKSSASTGDISTEKFAAVKPDLRKKKESESASAEEIHAKVVVSKKKEVPENPRRLSETEVEKKTTTTSLTNAPKGKRENNERKTSQSKGDHVVTGKEVRVEKHEEHETHRKPNLVQLELAEHGHFEAIPKGGVKKETKTDKSPKPVQAAVQKPAPPKKQVVAPTNGPTQSAGSEYSEVLGLLKTVQLTDAETQNLLQVLIVKQSERHTEWVQLGKKSADPATIAKRLVEDKAAELHDEKQMNKALVEQLKDMKNLLNQEKVHLREVTESSRQAADKVSVLEQQLKSVNSRLKDSQQKQEVEVTQLSRRVQEAENRASSVAALEEENRKIAERLQQKTVVSDDAEGITKELESVRAERDRLAREVQELERNQVQIQTETHVRSAESDESGTEVRAIQLKLEAAQENEQLASQSRDALESQVAQLTGALSKLESETENLSRQLENSQSELERTNATLAKNVEALKQSVKHEQKEESHLQKEVHQLTSTIEGLKKHEQEQAKRMRNEGFEEAKNFYEPQITETRDRHREVIHRVFPSVYVEHSLNSGEWLQEFERKASTAIQKDDQQSRQEDEQVQKLNHQLAELQDVQVSLQAEVDRYRTTLFDTETKLRELENSVQSEEEKWEMVGQTAKEHEHKCRHLETQLSEVLGEKKRLEERSSSVGEIEHRLQEAEERLRAFSSVQAQLDGLQAEAERLKGDLHDTRHDKDHLLEEADTLRRNLSDSSRVQAEAEQRASRFLAELTELRNKSDSLDTLHREAVDLRQALDMEKDNAKKMAQELLRARSLIQVGMESLRKEEETVSKLKEALESRENGLNGSVSAVSDTAHR